MNRRKIAIKVSLCGLLAVSIAANAFAEIDTMTGSGTSGGYGSSGGSGITCDYGLYGDNDYVNPENVDCMGWSWVYYKYIGGPDHVGEGMYFSPYHDGYGVKSGADHPNGAWISDKCAEEGKGFWHMGRNFEVERSDGDGPGTSGYASQKHDLIHRDTYTKAFVDSFWDGSDKARLEVTPEWAAESGNKAQMWYGGVLIDLNDNDSPLATYNPYLGRTLVLNHTLTNNGVPMYRAEYYDKSSNVKQYYYNETGNTMGDDVWGFCSYGTTPPPTPQSYTGSVNLKINSTSGISTSTTGNIADISSSDNEVRKVTSSTIYYRGFGVTTAQDPDSPQQETSYTVTISDSSSASASSSQSYTANDTANGPNERSLNLVPGVEYMICASNTYYSQYNSSDDPKFSSPVTATACTKVKYDVECSDFTKADGTKHKVGEHINYGRMNVVANSKSLMVGDLGGDKGFKNYDSIFSQPDKPMYVEYSGCMGAQARLDTSGGETHYTTGISSLYDQSYTDAENYVDKNSKSNANISGYELGLGWPQGSTNAGVAEHNSVKYQFNYVNTTTVTATPKVGNTYTANYSWSRSGTGTEDVKSSVDIKVPYNYILKPNTGSVATQLTIGDTYTLSASIDKSPRTNPAVGGETYATAIKPNTKSFAMIFAINENKSFSDLQGSLAGMVPLGGDEYAYNNTSDSPYQVLKNKGMIDESVAAKEKDNIIENPATGDESLKFEIGSGEKIGTKLCSLVAVYPADSHNIIGDINPGEDQADALTSEYGNNPYWRFKLSCATVGKSPSASIEGASMAVGGTVSTNAKTFQKRIYGSWAEYDIASTSFSGGPMGSGAAYAYDEPQLSPNVKTETNKSGLPDDKLATPQTLGNAGSSLGVGDASNYVSLSKKFAENIVSTYYESGNLNAAKAGGTGLDFVYSTISDQMIGGDITNGDNNTIKVIVGKNIHIAPSVKRLDAIIIAYGELDTCSSGLTSDAYEQDKSTDPGNQALLEQCGNELVINGAVYANSISLDRTFGGGSFEGDDKINPDTLMQRAEIFNYDPRIVKISYEINESLDATNASYVKELAPRL